MNCLPHIGSLQPYQPGFQPKDGGWLKLNTNENPYPCSPKVLDAITESLKRENNASFRLYPDPKSFSLREAIANCYRIKSSQVIAGNGSDDILNLIVRAFTDPNSSAAFLDPSYSLYPILLSIQKSPWEVISMDRNLEIDFPAIRRSTANILLLTSPNAPTGLGFSNKIISNIAEEFSGLLVVDEAYGEFSEESAITLISNHDNLIVTRSFSKSYSLAGMRVGYGISSKKWIECLDKVRDSYNLDSLAQVAAIEAIKDQSYLKDIIRKIKSTRNRVEKFFSKLGWFCYPSNANFIFVEPKDITGYSGFEYAQNLYNFYKSKCILVRFFGKSEHFSSFLRISIGTDQQMETVFEITELWLNESQK